MPECSFCHGNGVIDTGNGDYPCTCPAGEEAVFHVAGQGVITGAQLRQARREAIPALPADTVTVGGSEYIRSDVAATHVELLRSRILELEAGLEAHEREIDRLHGGLQEVQTAVENMMGNPYEPDGDDIDEVLTYDAGMTVWAIQTFHAIPPGVRITEGQQGHVLLVDYEGEITIELVNHDRDLVYEQMSSVATRWTVNGGRWAPRRLTTRPEAESESAPPGPSWHTRLLQDD